jgi:hypothetical protein
MMTQVKIKEAKYLEALEFLSRTLYIEPNNIKVITFLSKSIYFYNICI